MKAMYAVLAAMLALDVVAVAAAPGFEKVPRQAMRELKGAVGKPLAEGMVFVNGRYLAPPYRVARMGTAIFVNDVQVTHQVNSWRKFLATQPESAASAAAPAAAAAQQPAVAASLDELFEDEDAAGAKPAAAAEEERPFKANAKSAALLQEIDAYRTLVQRKLREGNVCFFGSRYARIVVEPRIAKQLLAVLPEAMREAESGEDMEARLRAGGIVFLNRTVCEELLQNRPDYLKITARRRQMQEQERAEGKSRGGAMERGR